MNATQQSQRLQWIEELPEIGEPLLRQRDELLDLIVQINALQKVAKHRRLALQEKITKLWLPAEIDQAKRRASA